MCTYAWFLFLVSVFFLFSSVLFFFCLSSCSPSLCRCCCLSLLLCLLLLLCFCPCWLVFVRVFLLLGFLFFFSRLLSACAALALPFFLSCPAFPRVLLFACLFFLPVCFSRVCVPSPCLLRLAVCLSVFRAVFGLFSCACASVPLLRCLCLSVLLPAVCSLCVCVLSCLCRVRPSLSVSFFFFPFVFFRVCSSVPVCRLLVFACFFLSVVCVYFQFCVHCTFTEISFHFSI